jgi:hypothetical protein
MRTERRVRGHRYLREPIKPTELETTIAIAKHRVEHQLRVANTALQHECGRSAVLLAQLVAAVEQLTCASSTAAKVQSR